MAQPQDPDRPSDGALQRLRTAFIQAAREILNEPDTSLDLRKVAERAGKSRTAPYLVFGKMEEGGGLEALRVAVAATGTNELIDDIELAVNAAPDREQAVQSLVTAYISFAQREQRLYRLMFGTEVARAMKSSATDTELAREVGEIVHARARLEDLFRTVVQGGQDVGAIAPGETWTLVLGAWALLHGLAMLMLAGQLPPSAAPAEAARLNTQFLMDEAAARMARAAISWSEAQVEKGIAPMELREAWQQLRRIEQPLSFRFEEPSGGLEDLASPSAIAQWGRADDRELVDLALSNSSALRRARRMRGVLEGSHILWIDDQPDLSRIEQQTLEQLGVQIVRALDTDEALALLARPSDGLQERGNAGFDAIISDIARPGAPAAGIAALPRIQRLAPDTPVIFYVGEINRAAGIPAGASGITNNPEELLHLVLDALERCRL